MKELIDIQARLRAPKSQYNSFGKYNYRSAEDILNGVKPLLRENGCTLTISDDIVPVGDRFYIKATCVLKNSAGETETTSAFAREEETKKGMDASQVTGAASSYARKYALNGLFAIDDTRDADALNTNAEYTQTAARQSSAPAQVASAPSIVVAIAEAANAKDSKELTSVWRKYSGLYGNDTAFVNAIRTSPVNPKANANA